MSGFRAAAGTRPVPELVPLRQAAERWYQESDLLIAALREHIHDLRIERDRLLQENDQLRSWLASNDLNVRGFRPQRRQLQGDR